MRRLLTALVLALLTSLAIGVTSQAEDDGFAFDGYLVKLAPPAPGTSPDATMTSTVRTVLGSGWTVAATDLYLEYRITPAVIDLAPSTAASAWSDVHRLNATGTLVRAEPLMQTPAPASPTPQARTTGTSYSECVPDLVVNEKQRIIDGALNDSQWSLGPRGANVVAAWALGTASQNAKGNGVVIGHPDTGFLYHPSINQALHGRGFNFVDRLSIALDTAAAGNLQWPGHGTRTSSVIAGRRFTLSKYEISGVAPEAKLMPLKVAHRVILVDAIDTDMENVAYAIRASVLGTRSFVVEPASVISMSLGGTPSRAVKEALDLAEEHNVIVLAAAGNQVPRRQVGFPARYPNVVAVAASNYDSGNWDYSSKGRSVAVTAPGQNVWTAKVRQVGGKTHYCIEPSSGTSYAVATTAGVAAMWLSYHRAELEKRTYLDVPRTFRALASCTAREIQVPDKDLYGGGIVDAEALLKAPLPDENGPVMGHSERCRLALISLPVRQRSALDRCANLEALTAVVESRQDAEALLFGSQISNGGLCARAGSLGDEIASLFARDTPLLEAVSDAADDHSAGRIDELRRVILRRNLSPQLRQQLTIVQRCARSEAGWCS